MHSNRGKGEFYASQDVFDKLKSYTVESDKVVYQGVDIILNRHLPNGTLIATGELAKIVKELGL